jgi:hypothetical protein
VPGKDYEALSGFVSFPDGVTTGKEKLTVLADPAGNLRGQTKARWW